MRLSRNALVVAFAIGTAAAGEPVSLITQPWTKVYRAGESLGSTPLYRLPLPAGTHVLRLINEARQVDAQITVSIEGPSAMAVRLDEPGEPKVTVTPLAAMPPAFDGSNAEILERAERHWSAAMFDEALTEAKRLVARGALTADHRRRALRLWAISAAVIEGPHDPKLPFRMLLQEHPAFELPADTAPKVLAAFQSLTQATSTPAAQVTLLSIEPHTAVADEPIPFSVTLLDPDHRVRSVTAFFKQPSTAAVSRLELAPSGPARWALMLPGTLTGSGALEYHLDIRGDEDTLLDVGSAQAPLRLPVVRQRFARPFSPAVTITAGAVTLASLATMVVGLVGRQNAQTAYHQLLSSTAGIEGMQLSLLTQRAQTFGTMALVGTVSGIVGAIVTGLFAIFTTW